MTSNHHQVASVVTLPAGMNFDELPVARLVGTRNNQGTPPMQAVTMQLPFATATPVTVAQNGGYSTDQQIPVGQLITPASNERFVSTPHERRATVSRYGETSNSRTNIVDISLLT